MNAFTLAALYDRGELCDWARCIVDFRRRGHLLAPNAEHVFTVVDELIPLRHLRETSQELTIYSNWREDLLAHDRLEDLAGLRCFHITITATKDFQIKITFLDSGRIIVMEDFAHRIAA